MFVSQNTADTYQILIVDQGDGSDLKYVEYVRKHIAGTLSPSLPLSLSLSLSLSVSLSLSLSLSLFVVVWSCGGCG
jgi:hypothetical protein